MTSAVLNVLITDDEIFESDETFNLVIDVFSLPRNVAVGDITQATVTILNDDGNKVYLFTIHDITTNYIRRSTYVLVNHSIAVACLQLLYVEKIIWLYFNLANRKF